MMCMSTACSTPSASLPLSQYIFSKRVIDIFFDLGGISVEMAILKLTLIHILSVFNPSDRSN